MVLSSNFRPGIFREVETRLISMPKENLHDVTCIMHPNCIRTICIASKFIQKHGLELDCYEHPEVYNAFLEMIYAYQEKLSRENVYGYCLCTHRTPFSSGPTKKVDGKCVKCGNVAPDPALRKEVKNFPTLYNE